jgi:hypothetical protein
MEYTSEGIIVNDKKILLSTIIYEVNRRSVIEENLVLLTITMEPSRNDSGAEQIICLTLSNAIELQDILKNKEVYFGDIFGKHSDVSFVIDEDSMKIDKDNNTVVRFISQNPSYQEFDFSFTDVYLDYLSNEGLYEQHDLVCGLIP